MPFRIRASLTHNWYMCMYTYIYIYRHTYLHLCKVKARYGYLTQTSKTWWQISRPQLYVVLGLGFLCDANCIQHLNYSLNSLKGEYIGDYIGDYYRGY